MGAAVALFGFAAVKASPIPEGLFATGESEDCEDVIEPAVLPDLKDPIEDVQAPEPNQDCEGEAIAEESILDIVPAFSNDSETYEFDEECEDEAPETPAPQKEDPPCYDEESDNNEAVEEITSMKENANVGNIDPLGYDDYPENSSYYY